MAIQFVQEDPIGPDKSRKKRARIVTSCDHCRRKRVKCSTRPDQTACDACLDSTIPCVWGDREHYYSQRAARDQAKAVRQTQTGKATRKKKEWSSPNIVADTSGITTHSSSALPVQLGHPSGPTNSASPDGSYNDLSASASPSQDDTDAEGEMDEPYPSYSDPSPPTQHSTDSPPTGNIGTTGSSAFPPGPIVLTSGMSSLTMRVESNGGLGRKRKLEDEVLQGLQPLPTPHYGHPIALFDSENAQKAKGSVKGPAQQLPHPQRPAQYGPTPSPYGPPVIPPYHPTASMPVPTPQSTTSIQNILTSTSAVPGQKYPLFNPARPTYPHPVLLQHCIDLLDGLGSQWKGLDRDDISRRGYEQTLPDVLANGIAALAARYSNREELFASARTRYSAGEEYCKMARHLVDSQAEMTPSLDGLYALLFISWSEYGSGRRDGFFKYGALAVDMLQKLDGPDAPYKVLPWNEEQELRLNLTWFATARLESCSSWLSGRPMVLEQARSSWVRKAPAIAGPVNTVLEMNRHLFLIREAFQKFLRMPDSAGEMLVSQLATIQNRLTHLSGAISSQIKFNKQNLDLFLSHRRASTFLLVHLVLHMLTIMANCPSIFRDPNGIFKDRLDVACHSAREIAQIMLVAQEADQDSVIAIPCFDMHIGVSAAALLMDSSLNMRNRSHREATEVGLRDCQQLLNAISGYWRPLDVILHRLERRSPWTFMPNVDEFYVSPHVTHKMLQSVDLSSYTGTAYAGAGPSHLQDLRSHSEREEDNPSLPSLSQLDESFAFEKSWIINASQAFVSPGGYQPPQPSASIAPWAETPADTEPTIRSLGRTSHVQVQPQDRPPVHRYDFRPIPGPLLDNYSPPKYEDTFPLYS